MKRKIRLILSLAVIVLLLSVSIVFIQLSRQSQEIPKNYETLSVSLGEEFTLHENQSAKIKNDDFEIKIAKFFNSPCPAGMQCVWSGVGIAFEYYHGGEVEKGINLVQAFGYQTTIIETDHITYAKLKVSKIES